MNCTDKLESVREYVKNHLSQKRYAHSMRVARVTRELCIKYGLDGERGYFAGVAHDMCKELEAEKQLETAGRDGLPFIELEKDKPSLLHGRSAAVILKEEFGIEDEEVLEAIRIHTSAAVGMSDFAKCLFIADKIEPGRPHVTETYLARFIPMTLNQMLYTVLKESSDYLQTKPNFVPFPQSKEILEYYKQLCEN